jgi:hypothetical protein
LYEVFQGYEWEIDQVMLEKIQEDERFQNMSTEEQDLFIKLANEKVALWEQKNYIIQLENEIAEAKINLSNSTTEVLKQDVASLSTEYQELIAQIQSAISAQRELNSLKSSTWFAEWGYTGSGDKYEVAWVVHKWEYVVPQAVLNKMPQLIPQLDSLRQWWVTSSYDYSKKIDVGGITMQEKVDLELFFDKLKFKL